MLLRYPFLDLVWIVGDRLSRRLAQSEGARGIEELRREARHD